MGISHRITEPLVRAANSRRRGSRAPPAMHCVVLSPGGGDDAALLGDVLQELGALYVDVKDGLAGSATEQPTYDESPGAVVRPARHPQWRRPVVTACFAEEVCAERLERQLCGDFGFAPLQCRAAADAAAAFDDTLWTQHLQAVTVGRTRLDFEGRECRVSSPGVVHLLLGATSAFGTGHHPTTRHCIGFLESLQLEGRRVLDYGAGSGVLAIRAALAGAKAHGVEIDPQALSDARHNAGLNGVQGKVSFGEDVGGAKERYHVVIANIGARVLKDKAKEIVHHLEDGGQLALSGILVEQAMEVYEAYTEVGIELKEAVVEEEWVLLTGIK